jgi:hypothetical protein
MRFSRPSTALRTLKAVPEAGRVHVPQLREQRLPGQDRRDAAQQQLELEVEAGLAPLVEPLLHLVAGVRPLGADLGKRQVALGQLGPAAVYSVENVDHEVDGLVRARHLLDVQVDVADREDRIQPVEIGADRRLEFRFAHEPRHERAEPFLHELRAIDPERVILHFQRAEERELLAVDVEMQAAERLSVAIKEFR